MANGYATLSAVLQDDRNLEFLQDDLDEAFWRQHRPLDPLLGVVFDYFRDQKCRTKSYREYWDEWIWQDWAAATSGKLDKFGIRPPACLTAGPPGRRLDGPHRRPVPVRPVARSTSGATTPVPDDFEWFEDKYPGWYSYFGPFWEQTRWQGRPGQRRLALEAFPELPPLCRVCLCPSSCPGSTCPRSTSSAVRRAQPRFLLVDLPRTCSTGAPERYQCDHMNFGEKFHGWDLADVIVELGLLRADGKTLIGQPHLSPRRCGRSTTSGPSAGRSSTPWPSGRLTGSWPEPGAANGRPSISSFPEELAGKRDFDYITPPGRRLTEYEAVTCYTQPQRRRRGPADLRGLPAPARRAAASSTRPGHRLTVRRLVRLSRSEPDVAAPVLRRPGRRPRRSIERATEVPCHPGSRAPVDPHWVRARRSSAPTSPSATSSTASSGPSTCPPGSPCPTPSTTCWCSTPPTSCAMPRPSRSWAWTSSARSRASTARLGKTSGWRIPCWQPVRRLVEEVMAISDWNEIVVAVNLVSSRSSASLCAAWCSAWPRPRNRDLIVPVDRRHRHRRLAPQCQGDRSS